MLPFDGIIDEVRISKIARHATDFTPPSRFEPDKDTLALYHFDEGQATSSLTLRQQPPRQNRQREWVPGIAGGPSAACQYCSSSGAPASRYRPVQCRAGQGPPRSLGQAPRHPGRADQLHRLSGSQIPPGEFMMGSTPEQVDASQKMAVDANQRRCIGAASSRNTPAPSDNR